MIQDKKVGNKRFTVYDSEANTALELINELGALTNEVCDSLDNKTDLFGDHKGSWQGLNRPTMSEEGMRATVEDIIDNKIPSIETSLDNIKKGHIYISDFTGTVQEAIDYCTENKLDLIINKDITVKETLNIDNNDGKGIRIVGTKNRPVITFDTDEDIPLFYFYGGSGEFSNTGIENLELKTTSEYINIGLHICGVCNGKFKNLKIKGFRYGIYLENGIGIGTFTELNNFKDIDLSNNINGLRIEQTSGDNSFHGNDFDTIYFNVYENQIGLNMVKGYLYNARFNLFMWCHSTRGVYVHCGGNAEHNYGVISYESFQKGQLTGSGRFWYTGYLNGIGGLVDNTSQKEDGEKIFVCDNYKKDISHETVGNITSLRPGYKYGGVNSGIFSVVNDNEESILFNGYDHGESSKLILGNTGHQKDLKAFKRGMYLTLNGRTIRTFDGNGLRILDSEGNQCANFNNGKISAKVGNHNTISVPVGAEQRITLTGGSTNSDVICLLSVKIRGNNFEYTTLFTTNHQGYGGNGSYTELASHYTVTTSGVSVRSISVNASGDLVMTITTDRPLDITYKYQAIGEL